MLIQINDRMYLQDTVLEIGFEESGCFYKCGDDFCTYLTLTTSIGNLVKKFKIESLTNKSLDEVNKAKQSIMSFLGTFFGKVGIKLILNDPNKLGMNIFD